MKRTVAVLALLFAFESSYAIQELTLTDLPPLQPPHNCKHSDGHFAMQKDPCGSDSTEFSSIMQRNPDGTGTYLPLGATMNDTPNTANLPNTANTPNPVAKSEVSDKDVMETGQKSWLKLLGFAFIFGIVAKLISRSFWRWFFVGIVLHIILVSLNILSF